MWTNPEPNVWLLTLPGRIKCAIVPNLPGGNPKQHELEAKGFHCWCPHIWDDVDPVIEYMKGRIEDDLDITGHERMLIARGKQS